MRRLFSTAILVAFLASSARADFGEYLSHNVDGQTLIVHTDMGELHVTAIDDAAYEVHYLEDDVKQLPSFALYKAPPQIRAQLTEFDKTLEFTTAELTAIVHKSPLRIEYRHRGQELLSEEAGYFSGDNGVGFRFALDEREKIMGGGERVLGMDRRGNRMPLYNRAHYGYSTDSNQMNFSLPVGSSIVMLDETKE
jgi:oligosaccharide 4-alpha-D-glucosyltransferase